MLKMNTTYSLMCDYCNCYLTKYQEMMVTTKESELYEVAHAKRWDINLGSEYREDSTMS